MRILILGAGGVGGFFGAHLQAAGADVTFLLRERRAGQIRQGGLHVESPLGNLHVQPRTLTQIATGDVYDLVMVSCKAYDLASTLDAIAPAVGAQTTVLPLLNGVAHMDALDLRFGRERVAGGLVALATTLAPDGKIRHMNSYARMLFGTRDGQSQQHHEKLQKLADYFSHTPVRAVLSSNIVQDMWEKYTYLCVLASATCTARASVGEILSTRYGEGFIKALLDECQAVAMENGHAVRTNQFADYQASLSDRQSTLTASMLRDLQQGGVIESEHIVGDMIRRGEKLGVATPSLKIAYTHLQAYEIQRARHLQKE